MSDTEVLTKCIEIAIENGWKTYSDEYELRGNGIYWLGEVTELRQDYFSVIFQHDFARCLFGEEEHTVKPGTDPYGEEDCISCEANVWDGIPFYCWQYQLQQMVISPNPIAYLRDYLESVKEVNHA